MKSLGGDMAESRGDRRPRMASGPCYPRLPGLVFPNAISDQGSYDA